MTLGAGHVRDVRFRVDAPTQVGWYDLEVRATYHAAFPSQTISQMVRVCVDNQTPAGLLDQRKWINIADKKYYTHPDWEHVN